VIFLNPSPKVADAAGQAALKQSGDQNQANLHSQLRYMDKSRKNRAQLNSTTQQLKSQRAKLDNSLSQEYNNVKIGHGYSRPISSHRR
jgi:septal ring factor EnvC (AmiA/AmiB activator)